MSQTSANMPASGGRATAPLLFRGKQLPPLLIWPYIALLVFVLFPSIISILLFSFWRSDFVSIDHTFTIVNYVEALSDPVYLTILFRTMIFALACTATALTLAFFFVVAVFRTTNSDKLRNIIFLSLAVPFLLGGLVRALAWVGMLGNGGLINIVLLETGIISEPIQWLLYSWFSVWIAVVYNTFQMAMFPILLSYTAIDERLQDASRDLGANGLGTFLRVTVPLTMPGIYVGGVLVFVVSVASIVEPRILGGSDARSVAGSLISDAMLQAFNYPGGSAKAILLIVLIVAAIALWSLFAERKYRVFSR